jgi:hypothetical protein
MDPLSAFAAAQTALAMIRKGVEFYKECKKANADVTEVTTEVSTWIGKFMDHKEVVSEAARKAKALSEAPPDPGKASTLNSQALNNVMLQIQLENAEKELREMLIYQTPGLGAVWTRFHDERERLLVVHKRQREAAEEQERVERILAADRVRMRKQRIKELWEELHWIIMVVVVFGFYTGCIYFIVQDRIKQSPHMGTCLIPKGSPGYKSYSSLRWVDCDN